MPAINRTDMPYPLRTLDGEVDVVADEIITGELVVAGLATFQDIYVAGSANIVGGTVDLANITANSLNVVLDTDLNTLDVTGLSTMADVDAQAVSSTGITCNGNLTVPQISNGIISAPFIASGNFTIGQALKVSDVNQAIVSYPNTGTGDNVRRISPQLTTPNIGAASGTSLSLSTPLGPSRGGTGQSSLSLVTVGTASNVEGGNTGQVVVQNGNSDTTFVVPGTSDRPLCSNGAGLLPSFKNLNLSSAVTGTLSISNGGTSTTTSTGSGSVVLQNTPTLTTPNIGAATGTSLSTSGTIQSSNNTNSNSASTGAIFAPNGGIGCNRDIWGGARVIANSISNATSTTDGAIQSLGGISAANAIYAGGRIITDSTTEATTTTDGSIQTDGGVSCAKQVLAGGRILCTNTADATTTTDGSIRTLGGISSTKNILCGNDIKATQTITSGGTYRIERLAVNRVVMSGDNLFGNRLMINPNSSYNNVYIFASTTFTASVTVQGSLTVDGTFVSPPNGARYGLSNNQSIDDNTETTIVYNQTDLTTGTTIDYNGSTGEFTNDLGRSISISVSFMTQKQNNGFGAFSHQFNLNGSTVYGFQIGPALDAQSSSVSMPLLSGDSFSISCKQTSGSTNNLLGSLCQLSYTIN